MSILLPLGLLGLIGIAVLILIYILKPNYQQKLVSSTYIWELSLKYRKKKIPVSRLRNLIILICQLLIIAACAMILAQPVIRAEEMESNERIAVIDASAGMLASDGGGNLFAVGHHHGYPCGHGGVVCRAQSGRDHARRGFGAA